MSRFGCPRKIVTDNAKAFTSSKLVKFCSDFNIILSHSTAYYPPGNGLVESSNKRLLRIIKKLLQDNKKAWNAKLKFALWEDRVSTKNFIGTSPFQIVYGTDSIFPTYFGSPVMKYLQEQDIESNPLHRRINQLVEVQHIRDQVVDNDQAFQDKVKKIFDKKAKPDDFEQGEMLLKWDARHEDKGKHGKFEHLSKVPYQIAKDHGNNSYSLQEVNGDVFSAGPINGRFLKHYVTS